MKIQEIDNFQVFGIHHQNADIGIREIFSISENHISEMYGTLELSIEKGLLILSTCNRTEIWSSRFEESELKEHFLKYVKGDRDLFEKHAFSLKGKAAIEHIFNVASSIDSQILGDLQIQSQIKRAVKLANEKGALNPELDRLIQVSLRYSKRIKNETEISGGAASVAYAAVQYILDNTTEIKSLRVLLYGTGKIGSVTCENLRKHIFEKNLVLTNRTLENAEKLAKKIGAEVKPIEALQNELDLCDILIVATGAEKFTIGKEHFLNASKKPRILIDLSVPRNIDPDLAQNPDIIIADVDHLSKMQQSAIEKRKASIPKAKEIINEGIAEFTEWLNIRHLSPTFKAIKTRLHDFKLEELEFHKSKISSEELARIEGITSRLMDKLARQMINHIKDNHLSQSDPVKTFSTLLDLDK